MNQFIDLPLDETLRHYQQNVKKEIYESWSNNRSIMLQMPTGTGKTRVFCSIVKDVHNVSISLKKALKVLILVHRRELIEQASELLGLKYNIAHGIIMSRFFEQKKMPVQLASIQTLTKRLSNWKDKEFDFIIVDEAHHSLAPTYRQIFETFNSAKILGVTATPYNLMGRSLSDCYNELITSPPVDTFINDGYLSNYKYYSIANNSYLWKKISSINEFDINGDYSDRAMFGVLDSRKVRADIMNAYLNFAKGKKGIVYTINKKHNIQIVELYKSHKVNAEAIDSGTDPETRRKTIEKFRDGAIDVICNVNIFSEGFDCPDIEFIQLARPTRSLSLYLQQVGRGLRVHDNIEKVIFLDNVGSYNQFDLPSFPHDWKKYFKGSTHSIDINSRKIPLGSEFIELNGNIVHGDEEVELLFETKSEEFDEKIEFTIFLIDSHHKDFLFLPYYFNYEEIMKVLEDRFDLLDPEKEIKIQDIPDEIFENTEIKRIGNYFKVRKGNNYGIINDKNEIIVSLEFENIEFANGSGLSICMQNEKKGLINVIEGKIVIPTEYEKIESIYYVGNFENYIIGKGDKEGLADEKGQILLPVIYEEILCEKKIYNVLYKGKWGVLNEDLKEITKFDTISVLDNNNLYKKVGYKNLFGLINVKDERIALPISYHSICYSNNYFIASYKIGGILNSEICLLMDNSFEIVISPKYSKMSFLTENYLLVYGQEKAEDGKYKNGYGVIDLKGNYLLKTQYLSIELFQNKLLVQTENNWIILDWDRTQLSAAPKKKLAKEQFIPTKTKSRPVPKIDISPPEEILPNENKIFRRNYDLRLIKIGMRIEHEKLGICEVVEMSTAVKNEEWFKLKIERTNDIRTFIIKNTPMRI